jgi:hypothetical protein
MDGFHAGVPLLADPDNLTERHSAARIVSGEAEKLASWESQHLCYCKRGLRGVVRPTAHRLEYARFRYVFEMLHAAPAFFIGIAP